MGEEIERPRKDRNGAEGQQSRRHDMPRHLRLQDPKPYQANQKLARFAGRADLLQEALLYKLIQRGVIAPHLIVSTTEHYRYLHICRALSTDVSIISVIFSQLTPPKASAAPFTAFPTAVPAVVATAAACEPAACALFFASDALSLALFALLERLGSGVPEAIIT